MGAGAIPPLSYQPIANDLARIVWTCFVLFMENDPSSIAKAILSAPAWARVGITAPKPDIRDAAAQELAFQICRVIGIDLPLTDPRQSALPF